MAPTRKPKSKHFSLREFEGRGKCPTRFYGNIQRVMDAIEVGYEVLAKKCHITKIRCRITPAGGYRSPKVNKQNKGRASKSQHLKGKAGDFVFEWWSKTRKKWIKFKTTVVFRVFDELQREGGIEKGGLGLYPQFIHLDVRGRIARWGKGRKKITDPTNGPQYQAGSHAH